MAEAVVEYDYKAQEPDELTIKKGDKISEIVFSDGGWWEGLLNRTGQRGMFPDNFVRLVSDPEGKATPQSTPQWSGRKCRVLFNYKPGNDDELELQIGDIIDIVSEVEEGWWKGRLKNRVGVFPSNFVVELTDGKDFRETTQRKFIKSSHEEVSHSSTSVSQETVSSSASSSKTLRELSPAQESPLPLPPKPVKEYCKALYSYEARNADELTFQEGDLILLISKEAQDPGWWKGEFKGKIGVFPDNFVKLVAVPADDALTKPERPSKSVSSSSLIKSKELTKTSSSSSVNSFSINRKFSDAVKTEEKINPPSVSKKPVLPPPPMKKPQRSSSDLSKSPTAPNASSGAKGMDASPTSVSSLTRNISQMSVSSTSSKHSNSSSTVAESASSTSGGKWTTVENIDSADGALWSKQSSYTVTHSSSSMNANSSSTSGVFTSLSTTVGEQPDLDAVSRAAMLTHPTASRVKAPKRRPPSTIWKDGLNNGDEFPEVKDVSTPSPTSSTSSAMVNGDAEGLVDKASSKMAPWVEELKISQAKKSMQAGKTRVMIGGEMSQTISSSSSSTSAMSSISSVVKSTVTSDGSTETVSQPSPMSISMSGVTLRSTGSSVTTSPQQRPQSMMSSLRSSLGSPQPSEGTVTLSAKQWNEILEKVAKVDQYSSQVEHLIKVVEKLSQGLEDARLQREIMRKELEKITDLVTQV